MSRSPTPILDLEAALPASRSAVTFKGLLKALPAAIGLIALFAATMFLTFWLGARLPSWLSSLAPSLDSLFQDGPFVAIPVIWLALFMAVLVHETGHAAAALLIGWHIAEFRVFPFSIRKDGRGWRLRTCWKLWPGGLVVANPPRLSRFHSRLRVYALGGPILNLVTGAVALLTFPAPDGSVLSAIPALFVLWSLVSGIGNLLPLRSRGLELDGYLALVVSRNPRHLAARIAAFRMRQHILGGKPLQSLNRRWVALAETTDSVSLQSRGGVWLAYAFWMDHKKLEKAALMLERLLKASGDIDVNFKAILFAECSVLCAIRGQRIAAHAWKDRASEYFLPEYLRRRCQSYVAWVEHDPVVAYQEALAAKDAALRLDHHTQEAFLPGWNRWIEALDKAQRLVTEASNNQPEMVFPYT